MVKKKIEITRPSIKGLSDFKVYVYIYVYVFFLIWHVISLYTNMKLLQGGSFSQ